MAITLRAQIEEVEYELKMRRQVYGRRDTMDRRGASERELHMARMEGVLKTLKWLQANEDTIKQKIGDQPDETISV